MPVSELVAVARTTDERWHSPLGDAAARAWGFGGAVFVRSSACHVFVTDRDEDGRRVVLRLRPTGGAGGAGVEALCTSARAAAALSAAGAPVAAPFPSLSGDLVETVDGYAVMALETVEGDPRDSDDVDPDVARRWGRTLADLHDRAAVAQADAEVVGAGPAGPVGEPDLPRTPDVFGLLHGDPEADNLVWAADGTGTFVDPDDVHLGWFAADVAYALRDWAPPAGAPDLADPVPRAFVEGYRSRRPLRDEELGWLPLLARAAAVRTLHGLGPVLAEPVDPGWPDWAHDVRARVAARADALRRALDG
jgi:Ser/Thr protein kinase RdoA (MazF antagonist)